MRFVTNLYNNFDELMGREVTDEQTIFNFETLSLVQEEELDLIVALEGMGQCRQKRTLGGLHRF